LGVLLGLGGVVCGGCLLIHLLLLGMLLAGVVGETTYGCPGCHSGDWSASPHEHSHSGLRSDVQNDA